MKLLLSWLREFAPIDAEPEAIAHALGALGTPVESMDRFGEGLDGVVVARVLALRPHPSADRVQLVDVDAGDGEVRQVVCGAFNMRAGDHVPLATVGAVLPNGAAIAQRKVRGEWSNGMLCSPAELHLGSDEGGILVLPEETALGSPLRDALGIADDVRYELEVNPNRPDAMSVAGLARDLAAYFKVPFTLPTPTLVEADGEPAAELASVEIIDGDLCGRFLACVLRDVAVGPSPQWLANRLTLLGMRPINNVVDASNYVMLELGQPNHPYDLSLLGGRGLRVRRAADGEQMTTLDGVTRTLTPDDLLICDADDAPVGIAGIMGGTDTEIATATSEVLLELAWFEPISVSRTARRLGLRTEASARFEKGADPEILDLAAARFCELLAETSPGMRVAAGTIDERGELPERPPVRLRTARVNAVLGTQLTGDEIRALLQPIGFGAVGVEGGDNEVLIPSFRPDSAVEIDLVEEVARMYGYERLGMTMPAAARTGGLTVRQEERRAVRRMLASNGLAEATPIPFLAPGDLERAGLSGDAITLANPLVAEESVLRTSLLPGLLKVLAYNASHRNTGAWVFEVGHVYRPVPSPTRPGLPDEREHLGVALAGVDATCAVTTWRLVADGLAVADRSFEVDAVPGLHPTRSARVVVAGETVGAVGEVDPDVLAAYGIAERVAWLEVNLERVLDLPHGERTYRLVSRFPSSDVDIAFEVDEAVPAAAVERTVGDAAGELLTRLDLFDVYRGPPIPEGRRSLAFTLRLQAVDRTLTDAEVGAVRRQVIEAVEATHPARLRS